MTTSQDTGIATERRLVYQPVILEPRPDGYPAEEVNALLLGVEQEFESCLREAEDRVAQLRAALRQSRVELAKLANLSDDRARQDAERCGALDADRQAAERRLAEEQAARHTAAEDARRQSEDQARQIARLEDAITSLKSSTSWRVTGPLRWVSRRLRRG